MSENKKKMLRRMGTSSSNWSKYGIPDVEQVPYINKDFDEDCKYDVNSNVNNEKKNKEIENNKKGGNKINELIDYFNESLSSDDEEEMELWNYTAGDKNNEPFSNEEEYEINGCVRTPSELIEEKENENVNTCCGQYISKIESQQEIEQNTEDVKIPKRICKFQPTTYEGFEPKETILMKRNTANVDNESFVSFGIKEEKQTKERSYDEEKPEITLDGINHNLSESGLSKQYKKCDAGVEGGENHKSDYKKKLKNRLILNRKIKVNKLYLYPQVGTTWNSYDKVLSRFCENSPKEIEVSIPKGGSFQISGFKVMNNKKKNNVANVTKTCIDGKKITFICK